MVFLSSTRLTDRQGRVEVAWPGFVFIRGVGGHHSKLGVEEIKTCHSTDLSVLWVLVKDKGVLKGKMG